MRAKCYKVDVIDIEIEPWEDSYYYLYHHPDPDVYSFYANVSNESFVDGDTMQRIVCPVYRFQSEKIDIFNYHPQDPKGKQTFVEYVAISDQVRKLVTILNEEHVKSYCQLKKEKERILTNYDRLKRSVISWNELTFFGKLKRILKRQGEINEI